MFDLSASLRKKIFYAICLALHFFSLYLQCFVVKHDTRAKKFSYHSFVFNLVSFVFVAKVTGR